MVPRDPVFEPKVRSEDDVRAIFRQLRKDITVAEDRGDLTLLYRRAGYVVTKAETTDAGPAATARAEVVRQVADEEFANTARRINRRARELECTPDYEEAWVEDPSIVVGVSSRDPLEGWPAGADAPSSPSTL
jgi:hypothetical protein